MKQRSGVARLSYRRELMLDEPMTIIAAGMLAGGMNTMVVENDFHRELAEFFQVTVLVVAILAITPGNLSSTTEQIGVATDAVDLIGYQGGMIHDRAAGARNEFFCLGG